MYWYDVMYIVDRYNKQVEMEQNESDNTTAQQSEQMENYRNAFRDQQAQMKLPEIKMPQMPSFGSMNFDSLTKGFKV